VKTGAVTVPPFFDEMFARHEPDVALPYVGMHRAEALSAANSSGVVEVRVIDLLLPPNTLLFNDLRPERLNLLVIEDRVQRAAFF
jgi:hypothetical protein